LNPNAINLFEKKPTELPSGTGHAYARRQALECLAQRGERAITAFKIEQRTTAVVVVGRNNDLFSQVYLEPWRMLSLDVSSNWQSMQQMFAYQLEGVQHTGHPNSSHQGFHCLPQTADLSHDYFVSYWCDDSKGESVLVGVEEVEHVPHDSQTGISVVLNNETQMASVLGGLAFDQNRFDTNMNTVVDRNGDEVIKSFRMIHVNMDTIATLRANPNAMEASILSELTTEEWGGIRSADLPPVVCKACLRNGAGGCKDGNRIAHTPRYARKHLSPAQKKDAMTLGWRKRNARWRHPQNTNENDVMAFRVPISSSSSSSSSTTTTTTNNDGKQHR